MIRVLIAASSPIVRAGLETLVAADHRFTVVANVSSAESLAPAVEENAADVLLIEGAKNIETDIIGLGENADSQTNSLMHDVPIIILTDETEINWTTELLRAGVRAILPRTVTANETLAAVEAAARGLVAIPAESFESLLSAERALEMPTKPSNATIDALTNREMEVLGIMAEGHGNKTIAYRLNISEHTVKFHIGSIFAKLGVSSRTEAVTQGIRRGLIML